MFEQNRMKRYKQRLRVSVERGAKGTLEAYLFLGQNERLIELMNDYREFLPFETLLGKFLLIPKREITEITPVDSTGAPVGLKTNPYKVLNVTRNASPEEVHDAYRTLMKALHPDRVRAAGLGDELIQYATERTQIVAAAYQEIVEQRERLNRIDVPAA
ncbi:J domain-containing protein [Futiania mangrovi]|uniref:DnaJ domain-containing protein n=1 Tax=Futiania mangrovi TaxID=2959716 RepID=A0A9J6PL37_9PROT|nr:DnaJ domain-containing protein [Futiania mangrovii]MCP1337319.1 DnaJ domain-containing protein [Futiania mangrovii]